jgi:hypothetical protein
MHFKNHIQRVALFSCFLAANAALAALGSASTALASNAYGSGAAVQKSIQETWIAKSGLSITYTSTNSADGFGEFGYLAPSKLEPELDSTAWAAGKQLDGYTAVDSAPDLAELELAAEAANSGGSKITGITVPVAQVPLALLISLPTDIETNTSDGIGLTNTLAEELYSGTVPASTNYAANTWGAVLEQAYSTGAEANYTRITTGTPAVGQFLEKGSSSAKTGGYAPITVEVRSDGAGATLALKEYFNDINATTWPSSIVNEETGSGQWPSGATQDGFNTSDTKEAQVTEETPGEVGYATLASATTTTGIFLKIWLFVTTGGSHDIAWAYLQDNQGDTPVVYANPQLSESPKEANVYTGANVGINGGGGPNTGAGNWEVPETSGTFNPLGDWAAGTKPSEYTHAWDPDVYLDVSSTNKVAYYPLSIALVDLSWSDFEEGNLDTSYTNPTTAGKETKAYLEYVTSATGQEVAKTESSYFAPLPSGGSGAANIEKDAQEAAKAVG